MEAIVSALKEEKKQAARLVARYQKELKSLPHGSFFVRQVKGAAYGYITYSKEGKIAQKYLGKLGEEELKSYREAMERKRKLKELKHMAERQYQFLKRALKHAG